MTEPRHRLFADQNPFSTSAIRPGAIPYQFAGGTSAASLVARLQRNNWRGEIVGPHGSGKSTLLQTLSPALNAVGRSVVTYVARPNESQLPISTADQATWHESTQVVVEGYELLSRRNRRRIDRACRATRAGLLITCHGSQGLPPLFQTVIDVEFAISLVLDLLPPDGDLVTEADVRDGFSRHGQNLRELLFEMYDLYEHRRPV